MCNLFVYVSLKDVQLIKTSIKFGCVGLKAVRHITTSTCNLFVYVSLKDVQHIKTSMCNLYVYFSLKDVQHIKTSTCNLVMSVWKMYGT